MTTKISGDNISAIANTGVNWNAVTVADGSTTVNASAGNGYILDTNTGVIEVFLPSSPTRGDTVILVDYAGTFATNNVIVNTGTTNLDSTTTRQYSLTTNDTIAEFVYIDSTKGWITKINTTTGTTPSGVFTGGIYDQDATHVTATGGTVTESGDYKIHTFTGDGCFVVSFAGAGTTDSPSIADYLVIAGGGGGGGSLGAGGGAGGYRESKASASPTHTASPHTGSPVVSTTGITLTTTTYPITVGSGGAGVPAPGQNPGSNGSNSIFSTITSAGGGFGSGGSPPAPSGPGGSGGGSGGYGSPGTGGTGNTPPVSPPQGNNGGGTPGGNPPYASAGGGGIGGVGVSVDSTLGRPGGPGVTSCISGSPVTRAGGGAGSPYGSGTDVIPNNPGGGPGGGGVGANPSSPAPDIAAMNGDDNTGGGGGGTGEAPKTIAGGAGGSGIVIIRYKFQ